MVDISNYTFHGLNIHQQETIDNQAMFIPGGARACRFHICLVVSPLKNIAPACNSGCVPTVGLVIRINTWSCEWEFQDPTDGGTLVPYKAIVCGDIHLHRPKNRPCIWFLLTKPSPSFLNHCICHCHPKQLWAVWKDVMDCWFFQVVDTEQKIWTWQKKWTYYVYLSRL